KTEIRSLLPLVCAVSAGLLVVGSPAQAGYIVTLEPVGSNVVATGSGAIDLTGLSFLGIFTTSPQVVPSAGEIVTGPTVLLSTVFGYTGISGPTNFGPGLATLASSGSGDVVGIISGQILDVPIFYVSGSPLSDTSTY